MAKNVVLTAKHCSAARRGNIATLGDHSRNDFDIGQRSIRIKDVFSNLTECPLCDFKIVILDEEVQTNEYVQIADLPSSNESCPTGKNLVACGWGDDKYNETRSLDKLWCVAQECVELSKCPLLKPGVPERYALCANDPDDKRNSVCNKDSGGPLTHTDENGKTTLYGVVWGQGVKDQHCMSPSLYSRVSDPNVLKWIRY